MYRATYAPKRSTCDGSFPDSAPPPWRAKPPYVSTTFLRPVRPASRRGPPTRNAPPGLINTLVRRSGASAAPAKTGVSTASRMSASNRLALERRRMLHAHDHGVDPDGLGV